MGLKQQQQQKRLMKWNKVVLTSKQNLDNPKPLPFETTFTFHCNLFADTKPFYILFET